MPTTQYTDATFGVREIAARTDAAGVDVDDLPLDEDRIVNHLLTEGFLTAGAFQVQADSPASMTVVVGSGTAKRDLYVVEGDDDGQHPYIVRLDDATVDLALDAADASNPRLDEVWLVVADAVYDGGSVSLPRLAVRKGDPSSSPSAPGPDSGWKAAVKLATVTVGTSATSVGASDVADNRREAVFASGVPVGTVQMTAAAGTPTGWLTCEGQAVSRSTYARLYAAIGTSFGSGDGSTTFNLPDLRDRFPVGAGSAYARGDTGGEAEHTLTTAELPSHAHSGPSHAHSAGNLATATDGDHRHGYQTPSISGSGFGFASADNSYATQQTEFAGDHGHNVTGSTAASGTGNTGSAGSGNAHENRPPYLGLRFIIFAAA